MAVEGKLDHFRLPEILQVISQQRKTGILTVQGDRDIIAVSFFQGRVVSADALNETTMEGVGGVLVEEGRIEVGTLHRLSSRADAEGKRLADLLVDEGHVERAELLEALRIQTARLLLSLLHWEQGEFKFYGGDEVSYEEGFRSIGVDELLLRAIEEEEPTRVRQIPSLDTRLRRLESERPVVLRHARTLSGVPSAPDDGQTLWVTPDEQRLLEAVSPDRTVADVADEAGVSDERARYVLFRFVREGLVTPVGGTPALRSTPARPTPTGAGPVTGVGAPPSPRVERPAPAPRPKQPARPAPVELPDPEIDPYADVVPVRPPVTLAPRALAVGAAVVAALLVAVMVASYPVPFFLPFPWLGGERADLHEHRDAAHLQELDLAAKTFFLLEGRFPDDLDEMVAAGLLERGDLFDSRGRRLIYEPKERSYQVRSLVANSAHPSFEEGIAGNFLLDPEIRGGRDEERREPPLVLLD